MQHMQADIDKANERFQRIFRTMNIIWAIISFVSITLSAYVVFKNKPNYLHDWHGVLILVLSSSILTIYCAGLFGSLIFRERGGWPPPLRFALPYWLSIYIGIALLSQIDANFAWGFYIVFGLSFALFASRRLVAIVILVFMTLCLYLGYFAWPLTKSDFGALFGTAIGFFAMTMFSMMVQHLIGERYHRNRLLQELAQANSELEEAHRKLAESSAQEQELAVLRERTRLAREMHDTLGHSLALVSIKLEAAQRLRERDPQRCERELEAAKAIVRNSMKELRASIANLRSPALEREPACRALSRYAREMAQRTGLRVSYDLHPDIEGLPEPVEETLWKVGQEALTNIEKHAQAHNVLLHISRKESYIFMKIQDDGIGLPHNLCQQHQHGQLSYTSPDGHYGLSGMFERVESIGGHISLRSGPEEKGTNVEVELPLVEVPPPALQ